MCWPTQLIFKLIHTCTKKWKDSIRQLHLLLAQVLKWGFEFYFIALGKQIDKLKRLASPCDRRGRTTRKEADHFNVIVANKTMMV